MSSLLKIQRILFLLALNLCFLVIGMAIEALFFLGQDEKLHMKAHCMMWWARCSCFILGIHITSTGLYNREIVSFIVSNHCSYLDILVIGSKMPMVFVSKQEVSRWFLLGRLTRLAGTVFVNREVKTSSLKALDEMGNRLHSGISVVVFPEGTTTSGMTVKDFKSTPFKIPIAMRTPILPISLLYSHVNGAPITPELMNKVAWYADMQFLPHFWDLAGINRIDVRVHFNSQISAVTSERKALASFACKVVQTGHISLCRELNS